MNSDNWCGTVTAGSFVAYAGSTGGEVTHKLTINEIPSHTHSFGSWIDWYSKGGAQGIIGAGTGAGNTTSRGGDAVHNNLPPYLVVYMWKRVS